MEHESGEIVIGLGMVVGNHGDCSLVVVCRQAFYANIQREEVSQGECGHLVTVWH